VLMGLDLRKAKQRVSHGIKPLPTRNAMKVVYARMHAPAFCHGCALTGVARSLLRRNVKECLGHDTGFRPIGLARHKGGLEVKGGSSQSGCVDVAALFRVRAVPADPWNCLREKCALML